MTLTNSTRQVPHTIAQTAFRLPLFLYQLGWGPLIGWIPLMILTTEDRNAPRANHLVIEYRRHGTKYYVVAARGESTNWYQNILNDSRVTIQHGAHIFDAEAHKVDNHAEALRALYMFSRNSWIYEQLFATMSSADSADLSTLAEVVNEFTVVRITPTGIDPELPPIRQFSKPVRQFAIGFVLLLGMWLMVSLLRRAINQD